MDVPLREPAKSLENSRLVNQFGDEGSRVQIVAPTTFPDIEQVVRTWSGVIRCDPTFCGRSLYAVCMADRRSAGSTCFRQCTSGEWPANGPAIVLYDGSAVIAASWWPSECNRPLLRPRCEPFFTSRIMVEGGARMEMAYRERWTAEIAEMRRVLGGFAMKEECKWGKPTFTVDGKNVVIMQGFKEYFALGFFQGALLKDPKKVLVQLGQVQAGRVMKFTSAQDIRAKATTIKAYVREALAVEKAGLRMKKRSTSDYPVP